MLLRSGLISAAAGKGFKSSWPSSSPVAKLERSWMQPRSFARDWTLSWAEKLVQAHVLQCSFLRLTAANALLELAAAIEEECLAPIVSTCIAARTVLNAVAQQIDEGRGDSQAEKSYVNSSDSLEPVPQVKQLMKITSEVEELSALTNPDINPVLHECHCFCWKLVVSSAEVLSKTDNEEVLLGAKGIATRNKKLLVTKGIATGNKDTTRILKRCRRRIGATPKT